MAYLFTKVIVFHLNVNPFRKSRIGTHPGKRRMHTGWAHLKPATYGRTLARTETIRGNRSSRAGGGSEVDERLWCARVT